jgi:hypothetical protein
MNETETKLTYMKNLSSLQGGKTIKTHKKK